MEVLSDKDLDRYYQDRFALTSHPGWEALMEQVVALRQGYADITSCRTAEELYFRKGQVDILDFIINTRQVAQDAYEQLLADENEDSDESV